MANEAHATSGKNPTINPVLTNIREDKAPNPTKHHETNAITNRLPEVCWVL
jgi:hypothetical protein